MRPGCFRKSAIAGSLRPVILRTGLQPRPQDDLHEFLPHQEFAAKTLYADRLAGIIWNNLAFIGPG